MANRRRILRLQQLILETAAEHVQRELEDPRIGLVSVTRVKLSPDLSQAVVFWSALGEDATVRTCERGLQDALSSIQRAVAHALGTRVTPRLTLRHDDGLVHAQRLEEIFQHLREERGEAPEPEPADEPEAGEDEPDEDEAGGDEPDEDEAGGDETPESDR